MVRCREGKSACHVISNNAAFFHGAIRSVGGSGEHHQVLTARSR